MPYKAAKAMILDQERYFVIPADKEIRLLVHRETRRISDEILCQCSTMEKAEEIASAMNEAEAWKAPL